MAIENWTMSVATTLLSPPVVEYRVVKVMMAAMLIVLFVEAIWDSSPDTPDDRLIPNAPIQP